MTQDVVLAARAAQELQPALQQFAATIGRTGPVTELVDWLPDLIHYRRAPHKAKLLVDAAQKIKTTGLPSAPLKTGSCGPSSRRELSRTTSRCRRAGPTCLPTPPSRNARTEARSIEG